MPDGLIPARRSARFARAFAAYCRRLMRRRFNAVRIARGGRELLAEAAAWDGPVMLALNHPSWWDPLLALLLTETLLPARTPCAPMDAGQLRRFRFMRRLGLFGLDPAHPEALRLLAGHVAERFARDAAPLLVLTPQGAFADVREPLRLRPGAAAIAARHPALRVLVAALEYPFWLDQRPEALVRIAPCAPPARRSTAAWHRALTEAMQGNADALACLSISRAAGEFETLLSARGAVHPLYDLMLRLRGTSPRLTPREGA